MDRRGLRLRRVLASRSERSPAGAKRQVSLNFYRATVSQPRSTRRMLDEAVDVAAATTRREGVAAADLVLTKGQVRALRGRASPRAPASATRRARRPARRPPRRCRAASTSGATTTARTACARTCTRPRQDNPQLTKLEVIGHTGKGREIIALKMTQGANDVPDGSPGRRALQRHAARPRVDRARSRPPAARLHRRVAGEQQGDQGHAEDARALVRPRLQPGRLPVHVPEPGHAPLAQEPPRQQRRRDTEVGDGVDPNRNYRRHWNYDKEGSSSIQSSDTYRGPSPAPSPRRRRSGPLQPNRLQVPGRTTTPSGRGSSIRRVADRHADRRRPDLLRPLRATATTPRSRASPRASRPTSCTSRTVR